MRKYRLDETKFGQVCPERDYWLGFLLADGYIGNKPNKSEWRVKVELQARDKQHLQKLCEFVKTDKPIEHFTRITRGKVNEVVRIELFGETFIEPIVKTGIVSPKINAQIDETRLLISPDFWRGYIDGDGCLTMNKTSSGIYPSVQIVSCNYTILQQLRIYIVNLCGEFKADIRKSSDSDQKWLFRVSCGVAYYLLQNLYYDSCVALERKRSQAKETITYHQRKYNL